MRALVTGASGFLGGFVCRELHARGHAVTALVRRPGSGPPGADEEAHADLAAEEPPGLPGVIVRPSHVYGPGGWFAGEFVLRLRTPGCFVVGVPAAVAALGR